MNSGGKESSTRLRVIKAKMLLHEPVYTALKRTEWGTGDGKLADERKSVTWLDHAKRTYQKENSGINRTKKLESGLSRYQRKGYKRKAEK